MEKQFVSVKKGWRFNGTFGTLALFNFICAIDATILSVALPNYKCSTVFQLLWAFFLYIIGRKPVFLAALLFFTIGTIIASIANNVSLLLVKRCVQSVGGGGFVAFTYVVITDIVTLRKRSKYISVIGPVIGGALAEKVTWRWIFWLSIPFCVITAGGVMYDWFLCRTFVLLLFGIFGFIGFTIYSVYISTELLIRRTFFNTSTAIVVYIGTLVQGLIVWSLFYYMPVYFEVAKNYSLITSAIAIFLFTFIVAPAAIIVGLVITKTGHYRPSLWIGWFFTTFGIGLFICLNQSTNILSWVFLSLVASIGLGILFSAQSFAAQASASNADLLFAGAMYSFFRAFGQTLGIAISGVIFQNVLKKNILATAYSAFADECDIREEKMAKEVVINAYIESLRIVWCIILLWTKEISLERKLQTEQRFKYNSEKKRPTVDEESTSMSSLSVKSG
ncbi:major facilitator superfamily domain-containing protein [Bisporella sp. PMI_857]|nr:major facilitator superfamily domain-containing protein [Bisporella sp. PMI_857]